jgi:adenosine/AMP kinase
MTSKMAIEMGNLWNIGIGSTHFIAVLDFVRKTAPNSCSNLKMMICFWRVCPIFGSTEMGSDVDSFRKLIQPGWN